MIFETNNEIKELVKAFEERTLSKTDWTHAAHLTVGLYYCLNYPFALAKNLMRDGILRLNDAHGTPNTETNGYHETLTVFWLLIIEEHIGKAPYASMAQLANRLIAECDAQLPFRFYSRGTLFSERSRAHFIEPEIQKLPGVSLKPGLNLIQEDL